MSLDLNAKSRDAILQRLRERLGRNELAHHSHAELKCCDETEGRVSEQPAPNGDVNIEERLTRFQEKAQALASTVDIVRHTSEIAAVLARYLDAQGLPRQAVCWPEWGALDWDTQGLSVEIRPAHGNDRIGITGSFAAVAETGSLVLCSDKNTPAATSLLPETHIAILPASRLVATMEEVWCLLRKEQGELPRAVNFVSGPSRTGDIEQTIVLGAHGPYRVHIIIVRNS